MATSKSSLSSKFSQKPSTSSMDNSKRIDDSTENYSLFEVNYDGFDCIEEHVGCDDGSLPVKIKDDFSNAVILDDVVSSSATLSMLLKRE
nr:hypothetical protein [Tanacetum cinerariifolium]